jgi:hypothetical protein
MTPRSPEVARNGHVRAPFPRHHFFHPNPGFGPFAFGAPLILPGGYFAGGVASGTPVIMLSEAPATTAPAPAPPRPAAEQRPSVETTAEGVVVVRGPGSHHIGY